MIRASNPKCRLITECKGYRVLATHIVTVPDQTALTAAAENDEQIGATSETLLEAAKQDAAAFDVPIETKTILSHRGLEEVYDAAQSNDADTVLIGYGGTRFTGGRTESALDELTHDLPCDFLVLDAEEFDPTDVVVPTAGGTSSDLSAEVALELHETIDAEVSLLHIAEEGEEEEGREFLHNWADSHQLSDAALHIETGDVESAIERYSTDHGLVIIGATERGLLSRIVQGSLVFNVIEEFDTPVLLTERPLLRSLRDWLFGR